jgi:subtilisin family serine protease
VGKNKSVDDAVGRLYDIGLITVAAAGNQNMDACRLSPAGSPRALTVASVNMNDQRTNTSNFGECVSIYAPGGLIATEGHLGTPSTRSGTSFAAPIVSGYAAIVGSKFTSASATAVANQLLNTARTDTVTGYHASIYGRGEASLTRALAPASIR